MGLIEPAAPPRNLIEIDQVSRRPRPDTARIESSTEEESAT
jgi:hypothetical protein